MDTSERDGLTGQTDAHDSQEPSESQRLFYGSDLEVLVPSEYDELAEIIRDAASRGRTVIPSGLGQHAYLGNLSEGPTTVVSFAKLAQVLRYEPGDFTVGVQAGIPVESLQETLAENHQELAIDSPRDPGSSVGGAVAANWLGPRGAAVGSLRNMIIGATGMRADGRIYNSGGMVVKNVAGYDISKLFVGSLGTLGPILELNFKLRPVPDERSGRVALFRSAGDAFRFSGGLRSGGLDPQSLAILDPVATTRLSSATTNTPVEGCHGVFWFFAGNHGTVRAQSADSDRLVDHSEVSPEEIATLEAEEIESGLQFLSELQEPDDVSSRDLLIARLSMLPTRLRVLADRLGVLLSNDRAESDGWYADVQTGLLVTRARAEADLALERFVSGVRRELGPLGANGRVLYCNAERKGERTPFLLRSDPSRALASRIQRVFDPDGIFHPTRVCARSD